MDSSDFISGHSEVGSLTAHSNEESQFVGSSSGVYFINTVRQAFSKSLGPLGTASSVREFPLPEDTIVGSEDSPRDKQHASSANASPSIMLGDAESPSRWSYDSAVSVVLGRAPPLKVARELMMTYFKIWHPLFPFLHGPTFLQAMELLYSEERYREGSGSSSAASEHRNACWTTTLQCVFNLASLLRPDLALPPESKIKSPTSIQSLLGTLTYRHDVPSLQALLAAQLYLVATMSLRAASTVGGCILRSMLHGGLHRCPFRYKELSSHDRHLRKRIFWCAYAIDRYLSQALGLPLGIQDSDIDVCLPGAHEIHVPMPVRKGIRGTNAPEVFPSKEPSVVGTPAGSLSAQPENTTEESPGMAQRWDAVDEALAEQQRKREAPLASYVESGKITGRALELFHKSIHARSIRRSSVLFLVSDVHKWWNSLPPELQGSPAKLGQGIVSASVDKPFDFGPFFTVLYQHLILIINRPSLSLDPSTPDFCSGLQTCIGAARGILTALEAQVDGGQALFWPGFLSAAWMSGLVLAFACQLRQYVLSKGSQEISECLEFLRIMSGQWETAKHCHTALSLLSANIRQPIPADSRNSSIMPNPPESPVNRDRDIFIDAPPTSPGDPSTNSEPQKKRKFSALHPWRETTSQTQQSQASNRHSVTGRPSRTSEDATIMGDSPRRIDGTGTDTQRSTQRQQHPGFSNDIPGSFTGLHSSPDDFQHLDDGQFLDSSQWAGVNFDLNMTDLLQGANLDTLFDMIGQQFPSF